jgi:hypothetical protein
MFAYHVTARFQSQNKAGVLECITDEELFSKVMIRIVGYRVQGLNILDHNALMGAMFRKKTHSRVGVRGFV